MHDPRLPFDSRFAGIYDAMYPGRGKDYPAEVAELTAIIRAARPDARSLVDVACGTGLHLNLFVKEFEHVEGVELAEDMLAVAKNRMPDMPLHVGDMRDLELNRTFDAVTCLFAAVGHMRNTDELDRAIARLAAHLTPGGVLIVEPWWFPEQFTPQCVVGDVVQRDGFTIARMSYTDVTGNITEMQVHYLVGETGSGLRHFTNTIVNSLFTREEHESAFVKAGCTVSYQENGPSGRGRFIGVRG
jgi:SAM-dependent methyltransferase